MANNEEQNQTQAQIQVGITPQGNVALNVTDVDGHSVQTSISLEEAERLSSRLQSLASFLLQLNYMEMARQQSEASDVATKLGLGTNNAHLF